MESITDQVDKDDLMQECREGVYGIEDWEMPCSEFVGWRSRGCTNGRLVAMPKMTCTENILKILMAFHTPFCVRCDPSEDKTFSVHSPFVKANLLTSLPKEFDIITEPI